MNLCLDFRLPGRVRLAVDHVLFQRYTQQKIYTAGARLVGGCRRVGGFDRRLLSCQAGAKDGGKRRLAGSQSLLGEPGLERRQYAGVGKPDEPEGG